MNNNFNQWFIHLAFWKYLCTLLSENLNVGITCFLTLLKFLMASKMPFYSNLIIFSISPQ